MRAAINSYIFASRLYTMIFSACLIETGTTKTLLYIGKACAHVTVSKRWHSCFYRAVF